MKKLITFTNVFSKILYIQVLALIVLVFTITSFSYSQIPIVSGGPLKPGQSVVTSYDPVNSSYNPVRVIDVRNSPPFVVWGNFWNPNSYTGADWTQSNIGRNFSKLLSRFEATAPLHRGITIDEVGNVAAFLLSDLASAITGEIMYVDGGYSTVAVGGES